MAYVSVRDLCVFRLGVYDIMFPGICPAPEPLIEVGSELLQEIHSGFRP